MWMIKTQTTTIYSTNLVMLARIALALNASTPVPYNPNAKAATA